MLTTSRIAVGEFDVLWNGKPTHWTIHNGSLGFSGHDTTNLYAIHNSKIGVTRIVGKISSCKALLTEHFRKLSVKKRNAK